MVSTGPSQSDALPAPTQSSQNSLLAIAATVTMISMTVCLSISTGFSEVATMMCSTAPFSNIRQVEIHSKAKLCHAHGRKSAFEKDLTTTTSPKSITMTIPMVP